MWVLLVYNKAGQIETVWCYSTLELYLAARLAARAVGKMTHGEYAQALDTEYI